MLNFFETLNSNIALQIKQCNVFEDFIAKLPWIRLDPSSHESNR